MSARWKNNREYSFRIFAGCFVFGGGSDFPGASFLFDFPPVHQCVSNRQFIHVFQFVAEADPRAIDVTFTCGYWRSRLSR